MYICLQLHISQITQFPFVRDPEVCVQTPSMVKSFRHPVVIKDEGGISFSAINFMGTIFIIKNIICNYIYMYIRVYSTYLPTYNIHVRHVKYFQRNSIILI